MPVIVVGADAASGAEIVSALAAGGSEVRAFVTDAAAADSLRASGAKVAVGDITDASHVGGAALHAFCAVLIASAATDDRERSFADSVTEVFDTWAEAVSTAGIRRIILVAGPGTEPGQLRFTAKEFLQVGPGPDSVDRVVAANDAAAL